MWGRGKINQQGSVSHHKPCEREGAGWHQLWEQATVPGHGTGQIQRRAELPHLQLPRAAQQAP